MAIAPATVRMRDMPIFTSDGTRVFAAYIAGPSHILLGLQFSGSRTDSAVIVRKPAIGGCRRDPLDEDRVVGAVLRGVAEVSPDLGVSEIVYVEDDSPNYGLYTRAASELARRYLAAGGRVAHYVGTGNGKADPYRS